MLAVGRPFESTLLPTAQAVLAHQPSRAPSPDSKAIIPQLARHARTAIRAVRQRECRADMRQHHQVIALPPAGRTILPGEIAALADAEHLAQAVYGEILLRLIDERKPHRLPSRAKKAVARFSMSRSCRRISFSRRSRFNSAAISACGAWSGITVSRSRRRPIHRTSVDRPTPRSSATSRCVRPLVATSRTASSSNSFVNRRCFVIEFAFHLKGTLHFFEASPCRVPCRVE